MTKKEKARWQADRANTHASNHNTKERHGIIAMLASHPSIIVVGAWIRSRMPWRKSSGYLNAGGIDQ